MRAIISTSRAVKAIAQREVVGAFMGCGALIASLTGFGHSACAQTSWPSRQVSLVVPYPPGGYLDVVARLVAERLQQSSKQTVLVINRPGGNGQVGLRSVSKAEPDGYTLLVNNDGGIALQAVFDPNFQFDPLQDYTPVAQIVASTYYLIVRSSLPAANVRELIDYVRKSGKELAYGSPGQGTTPHLGMEYFTRQVGVRGLHVPYSGTVAGLNDMVGGQIDAYMSSMSNIASFVERGQIRVLAAVSTTRSPQFKDIPTIAEAGVPDFSVPGWLGLFGPPGLAGELRASISKAIADTVREPSLSARLQSIFVEPTPLESAEFAPFYVSEIRKWSKFKADANIKIDP